MTVYVDNASIPYGRMFMCHMIADDLDELHTMAEALGVRKWFQEPPKASFPHYDICLSKRDQAIGLGAVACDRRVFSGHLRRIRETMIAEAARPARIQLSRRRGYRKPDGAVVVSRPSAFGNPYHGDGPFNRKLVVDCYREWINRPEQASFREKVKRELRGRDLACWCPLDEPCHADVLLEIANG